MDVGGDGWPREGGVCGPDMEMCEAERVALMGILEKKDGIALTNPEAYSSIANKTL